PAHDALFEGKDEAAVCALHRVAEVLTQAGHTQSAEALLEAILTRAAGCARAAEVLGLHLLRDHDGERAITVMRTHHEANPEDVRLIQALSHAYRMTRRFDEAIRLFHLTADTLAEDRENQYMGQLVALYLISDTVEEWVDHWRGVLAREPDNVTARFLLGTCLHYLDDFEASNAHLEALVGVLDHEPRLYVYRGMNAYNLGRLDEARALLEEGIKLPVIDPDVFYCRAEITRDTERDLALSDLERYLTLTGRSQFENPGKRERVVEMRDALLACKAAGTAVCDGPWEHPRSLVVGFMKRNEVNLFALGGVLALLLGIAVWRRRRQAA
ncbi:MAG: tetratricopeptide repeat protein, partial [Actinomycetota bacterium]|nr:tetratricopeptide repeat protein [Actinomycetota bacterium]